MAGVKQELNKLLVYFLGEAGASFGFVKHTVPCNSSLVYAYYNSEVMPRTRFLPEFIERVRDFALRTINDCANFSSEYNQLLGEAPGYRTKPQGCIINPEILHERIRKLYALAIVNAWEKGRKGNPAIYKYSDRIRGRYSALIGDLFMLPNDLPSLKKKDFSQEFEHPCLAISYKASPHKVVFYTENCKDVEVPMVVTGDKHFPNPVPLSLKEISDICISFFERHNYKQGLDLRMQVEGCGADGVVHFGRYSSNYSTVRHRAPLNGSLLEGL